MFGFFRNPIYASAAVGQLSVPLGSFKTTLAVALRSGGLADERDFEAELSAFVSATGVLAIGRGSLKPDDMQRFCVALIELLVAELVPATVTSNPNEWVELKLDATRFVQSRVAAYSTSLERSAMLEAVDDELFRPYAEASVLSNKFLRLLGHKSESKIQISPIESQVTEAANQVVAQMRDELDALNRRHSFR